MQIKIHPTILNAIKRLLSVREQDIECIEFFKEEVFVKIDSKYKRLSYRQIKNNKL